MLKELLNSNLHSNDVVVQGADLINGLLTINLEKIIPDEKKPRTIEIKTPKRISG